MSFDSEGERGRILGFGRVIQVGDLIRAADYVHTLLVPSSNGAAQALARGTAGSARSRVRSYFLNPHGLTDTDDRYRFGEGDRWQRSTADIMARLTARTMSRPQFRETMRRAGLVDILEGNLRKTGTNAGRWKDRGHALLALQDLRRRRRRPCRLQRQQRRST